MKHIILGFAVMLIGIGQVDAGTVAIHRDSVYFDGNIIGYNSGLEWMTLLGTQGSRDSVLNKFGPSGFHIATEDEIRQMFEDLLGLPYGQNRMSGGSYLHIFGENMPVGMSDGGGNWAAYDTGYAGAPTSRYQDTEPGNPWVYTTSIGISPKTPTEHNTWWLVRDRVVPVPEPSSIILLLVGIMGLGFARRIR